MNIFPSINEQMDVIKRGVSEIIPEDDLVRKIEKSIKTNKQLIVKLGCDPSRPDLHLGHSVVLRKLRQFQDLGHMAILIVGDFTGMIGDPSGKSKTRPSLSLEETRKNGETYFDQAKKILSDKNIKMIYNSEWLGKMSFAEVITLASKYTVSQMLEREDFHTRFNNEEPIEVRILDFFGNMIMTQTLSTEKNAIDVTRLPSGYHILQARQNEVLQTIRFTKK